MMLKSSIVWGKSYPPTDNGNLRNLITKEKSSQNASGSCLWPRTVRTELGSSRLDSMLEKKNTQNMLPKKVLV